MPRLPKLPTPTLPGPFVEPPPRPGESNGNGGARGGAREASVTVVDWIDERTSLSGATRWLLFRKVPKGTNWFYTLGSATLFAFLSQAVTGVFLAMYYRPDAAGGAYESIRHVTNEVFLGHFLRGGGDFGATTLSRFYAIHMLLVPGLIIALIGAHLYLVTKLGTTAPPWRKAKVEPELREAEV